MILHQLVGIDNLSAFSHSVKRPLEALNQMSGKNNLQT